MDDDSEKKKAKRTKKHVIKCEPMFKIIECLFNGKVLLKLQQRFKSDPHKVYTEELNKIALSSGDNKRLPTFDGIESFPYGTNAFKVSERKMMTVRGLFVEN